MLQRQLQAIVQPQRLAQIQQQQMMQSLPQLQRIQMHQRPQIPMPNPLQLISPARPSFDGGLCARRLMQYMYHQSNRPADNSIIYWRKFVVEYFSPRAKKRWCFSQYNNAGNHAFGAFPQASMQRLIAEKKCGNLRQFSVFNEFSKQLKGEVRSNQEFQRSVKDLNEKLRVVKEDLNTRRKNTTEKLHKSVDNVWIDAEATSKKVAENVKEKLTAAKEEVKESLGLGTQETSGSSHSTTTADSFREEDGDRATTRSENNGDHESSNSQEQAGGSDTLFDRLRMIISSASPKFSLAFQKLQETKFHDLAKKGYDMIRDELSTSPSKRRRMRYTSTTASSDPRSTRTDVVIVPSKQSPLGEKWEAFKRKVQNHPIYKRARGISEPVVAKGQEIAEDVRETLETSDHPLVHKIIDLNEAVFGENATALSFKEIRRRDPAFSLPEFVQEVQEMIRPVLTAYYKGDIETLKKNCSSEVIERCKGERMAYDSQGIYFDNKILHISEVDVRETKMMGSSPIIVLAFQTQQIYCVRDRQGSITSGGQDTIQTVYYGWAMQLVDAEELGEGAYYPVWRLREMQQLGVQALI